jgi:single-strand DNA-binding protein
MYLNDAHISLTGYVATQPVTRTVNSGATNTSMRVAWTPRRQDRVTGEWVDGNTSYVTVICWRKLATHAALSLRKGDPVVVRGRLSIRSYEDKSGQSRTAVEVEASTVGHDLSRGVAVFSRTRPQTGLTASEFARSNGGSPEGGEASRTDGPPPLSGSGEFADTSRLDTSEQVSDGNDPEELDESLFNQDAVSEQPADPEPAAAPF